MPLELHRAAATSPAARESGGWTAPRRMLGLVWSQTRGVLLFIITTVDDTFRGVLWPMLRRGDAAGALRYLWLFVTDFWTCSIFVAAMVWALVWGVGKLF